MRGCSDTAFIPCCISRFEILSAMSTTQKPEVDEHTKKILAVRALMRERDEARSSGDFGKSDTLRDKLKNDHGVIIFDQNGGPSGWKFKDGSTKKLPAGIVEAEQPVVVKRKREEGDSSAKKQKPNEQPKPKGCSLGRLAEQL